jgi:hypothetical protein
LRSAPTVPAFAPGWATRTSSTMSANVYSREQPCVQAFPTSHRYAVHQGFVLTNHG